MDINIKIKPTISEPLYVQIKDQLKKYIKDQQLLPNTRLPSVNTVAIRAGVSVRTADMAFKELAREGMCFRRPKKGAFVADMKQNNYRKAVFGYILGKNEKELKEDLLTSAIHRGFMSEVPKYSISPIAFSLSNIEEDIEFYHKSENLLLKGVVIATPENSVDIAHLAKKYPDLNFIITNYFTTNILTTPDNVIGVLNDDAGGAYQLMDLMLKSGKKVFGIIDIPVSDDNYENRIKGFRMALKNSSLRTRSIKHTCLSSGIERCQQKEGWNACKTLLATDSGIDAFMCVNDELARGVLRYLREHEINDVAVCGYDNLIPQKDHENSFVTMEIDFEEMGKTAVSIIAEKTKEYPKIIKISPVLIKNNIKEFCEIKEN